MLSSTLFHCGGADLVARWLVGLFSKAQADERQRNRGQQGHGVEEGDGMQQPCHEEITRGFHTRLNDVYRHRRREVGVGTYLIGARRRRAARTCRGREPPSPGWWPLCGCAGWAWWGRTRSTCCIGRPYAWGSHTADLEGEQQDTHSMHNWHPTGQKARLCSNSSWLCFNIFYNRNKQECLAVPPISGSNFYCEISS